jgi:hypothetical protein
MCSSVSPAGWSDLVDWFSDERRDKPSEADHYALVRLNLRQLAEHTERTRELAERNADRLDALCAKTDQLHQAVNRHQDEAQDLLEAFRFSRQLRRWVLGLLGLIAAIGLAVTQSHALLQHLRELLQGR